MHLKLITLLAIVVFQFELCAQSDCGVRNNVFASGEELKYKVTYNWGMIWLESAEALFRVRTGTYANKRCYLLTGSGSTFPKYDWFFKVRDLFETYVDSASFRPLKFYAEIHEGSKRDKHSYLFNSNTNKVYTFINHGTKPMKIDTLSVSDCSIDVLTAIYYARNLDYSGVKVNDTIGISLILDGKLFPVYVRYLGKDVFTSKELGKYKCIKFRPLLVEGSIFKKGEHMTVWVTDDKNKVPLYIETAIIVGSVKVYLMSYKGLVYPETAKIKTD